MLPGHALIRIYTVIFRENVLYCLCIRLNYVHWPTSFHASKAIDVCHTAIFKKCRHTQEVSPWRRTLGPENGRRRHHIGAMGISGSIYRHVDDESKS